MTARPAFDWKPIPHPFSTGSYMLARRPADCAPLEERRHPLFPTQIEVFRTKAEALAAIARA
jgi:hypothetical protein